ncbi:hypothetical protein MSA03_25800 [Microbacterium saccharophilum]|uniref:hypothetical protein n=1 Tax=Microbacterium saccharophilum TaxID=1213358 RepID=UPI00119080C8|nr:hypothetical protein [Microbacterium saccharophilum]GEP49072.1 hypothetical protein MSA03_25800 [Microbacterium saccharophilum]
MSFDNELGAQPRCPTCGVVMRDEPGATMCPSCGRREAHDDVVMPPSFDGPAIRGG